MENKQSKIDIINVFFDAIDKENSNLSKIKTNHVLQKNQISKGRFYHYFKNKEDLVSKAMLSTLNLFELEVLRIVGIPENEMPLNEKVNQILDFLFTNAVQKQIHFLATQYKQERRKCSVCLEWYIDCIQRFTKTIKIAIDTLFQQSSWGEPFSTQELSEYIVDDFLFFYLNTREKNKLNVRKNFEKKAYTYFKLTSIYKATSSNEPA
jgi:AcrR family transcriptional regulator